MGARVDSLVLRERDLSSEEYIHLAKEIRDVCEAYGVDFYVHRRPAVCPLISCPNLHLSFQDFEDLSKEELNVEKVCVSIHSLAEAAAVRDRTEGKAEGWSLMFGNVFETSCKPGLLGKGIEIVRELLLEVRLPLYLIGGISWERISELQGLGVYGFAMRSECMK